MGACDGVTSRAAREPQPQRRQVQRRSRLAVGVVAWTGWMTDGIHAKRGAGGWQQLQPPPPSCSRLRPTGRGIPACVLPHVSLSSLTQQQNLSLSLGKKSKLNKMHGSEKISSNFLIPPRTRAGEFKTRAREL